MRITFLKAGGWGNAGGDRVIAIHAANLKKKGHDVTVIAVPPPPRSTKDYIKFILSRSGGKSRHSGIFDNASFNKIMLKRFRIPNNDDVPDSDILITTWFETAEWAELLDCSKGIRVSFIQGYEAFDFIPVERLDRTWQMLHPKITISKWLFDLSKERFLRNDVFLVPNSVDRTKFSFERRVKCETPTIGFLYHTMYSKGVDVCLKVIEALSLQYESIKLITFGHGAFSPQLPHNVSIEHFNDPAQEFIKDIYAKCDVWLCGSSSEGFHLPPLEAMACGSPVVSTMVGGPLDTIVEGKNGYLAPIGDIGLLSSYLRLVLDLNNDEWMQMSRQAADTGADYSWEDASDKFELCLRQIINR